MGIAVRRASRTDYLTAPRLRGPSGEAGGLSPDRGYFLAEDNGRLVGCVGWTVENLIARLEDVRLAPGGVPSAAQVLTALLEAVHHAARELECEVVLLALDADASEGLASPLEAMGYERRAPDTLPRYHREAAREILQAGQVLWARRLRESRVTRPL
ncbi:MAG: hypothetical protein H5T59_01795 [Anaerolineae bacterium]|nr:hypothetical protein [Anaerolineae bacterium]